MEEISPRTQAPMLEAATDEGQSSSGDLRAAARKAAQGELMPKITRNTPRNERVNFDGGLTWSQNA
jgi:hypothetical protein